MSILNNAKKFVRSNPRNLVAAFLAILFTLGTLGHLDGLRLLLDSQALTFELGDFSLSIYQFLKGIVVLIALLWAASVLSQIGNKLLGKMSWIKSSNRSLISKVSQIVIYLAALLVAFRIFDFDLTALAVFSGAVGVGLGFGLQKITSNFISGLILLFEKSIEDDDLIELADGTHGFVSHTGARHTLIRTFDGREIMIPNEDFITKSVVNWTYSSTQARADITIGVAYESDIELARELMLEAAREHPSCLETPEPQCFLMEFADSSVNFLLYFWIGNILEGRYPPSSDVRRAIWRKFKENDIGIPYPQRDLHIKSDSKPVQSELETKPISPDNAPADAQASAPTK